MIHELPTTRNNLKKLWLMGTLSRLYSLQFVASCPYSLVGESNDLYVSLDPRKLFRSDMDILQSLEEMVKADGCMEDASKENLDLLGELVLGFADYPETMLKIYLEENEGKLL